MGREKATVMVCDNPKCQKESITRPFDPALGFYLGKGMWHFGAGGGPIPATYACSKECILPAIEYQIDPDRWDRENR